MVRCIFVIKQFHGCRSRFKMDVKLAAYDYLKVTSLSSAKKARKAIIEHA